MTLAKPDNRETHVAGGGEGVTRRRFEERRDRASRDLLEQRVAAEFREMPCLRVTAEQAEKLFGLRGDVLTRVVSGLMQQGLVRVDADGRFAAAEAG